MIEEPLHGPLAAPGEAVLHLAFLFGDVNVDRRATGQGRDQSQLLGRHGPQAVRRDANQGVREGANRPAAFLQESREGVGRVEEPPLAGRWGGAAEAALGIEDRQQGQADPRHTGRRRDGAGQLGGIGIGAPVHVVMQVVELAHRSEATLEHLRVGQGGDGAQVVRVELIDKPVHHGAPGPEVVTGGSTRLGEARHAALEGVAVDITKTRNPNRRALVTRRGCAASLYADDRPARVRHPHAVGPSHRQQSRREPQSRSRRKSRTILTGQSSAEEMA